MKWRREAPDFNDDYLKMQKYVATYFFLPTESYFVSSKGLAHNSMNEYTANWLKASTMNLQKFKSYTMDKYEKNKLLKIMFADRPLNTASIIEDERSTLSSTVPSSKITESKLNKYGKASKLKLESSRLQSLRHQRDDWGDKTVGPCQLGNKVSILFIEFIGI